jgi:hypothetical protein
MPAGRPRVNRYERRRHKNRCEDKSEFCGHVLPLWGEMSSWIYTTK